MVSTLRSETDEELRAEALAAFATLSDNEDIELRLIAVGVLERALASLLEHREINTLEKIHAVMAREDKGKFVIAGVANSLHCVSNFCRNRAFSNPLAFVS